MAFVKSDQFNVRKINLSNKTISIYTLVQNENNELIKEILNNKHEIKKFIDRKIIELVKKSNFSNIYNFSFNIVNLSINDNKKYLDGNKKNIYFVHQQGLKEENNGSHIILVHSAENLELHYNYTEKACVSDYDDFLNTLLGIVFDYVMFYYNCLVYIYDTKESLNRYLNLKNQFLTEKFNDNFTEYNYFLYYAFENGEINWKNYKELWQEFLRYQFELYSLLNIQKSKELYNLIINHSYFKDLLNHDDLKSEINNNLNSEIPLILVRISKKPEKEFEKSRILKNLGKTKFHIGHFRLINFNKLTYLFSSRHYLSIYLIY